MTVVVLVRTHGKAGANKIAFSGRFGKHRLAKGSYTATVTATDTAGNRSKARTITFTVAG